MKLLQTEQQEELRSFISGLYENESLSLNLSIEDKSLLSYWRNELKPKRVRRNPKDSA